MLEDASRPFVRPVVQDVFEEVDICMFNGLWRKEIMPLEGYPRLEVGGHEGLEVGLQFGAVLHDAVDVWVVLRDLDRDMTGGATDLGGLDAAVIV